MVQTSATNFGHLKAHDEQLVRLGMLAERYFPDDPNTCLLKLRQLAEALAQLAASQAGLFTGAEEKQADLLRRLQDRGILPREVSTLFHEVRRAGNDASHKALGDHRVALGALRLTWQLSLWFHRTFKDPGFKSGPFVPPAAPDMAPAGQTAALQAELEALRAELAGHRSAHQDAARALETTLAKAQKTEEEKAFWEGMAAEAEAAKHELAQRLKTLQEVAAKQPAQAVDQLVQAATSAAAVLQMSEADTRRLIDAQLVAAGWEADSVVLDHRKGARPQKGRNLAIAEWPTESGPADYVLFAGLKPLAVVEAKRRHIDVSAALQQAKRYSRDFSADAHVELHASNFGPGGAHRVPFAFSSNGRPFLRQLATKSGVWFCDLRRPENLGQPLDGWYTPEGLAGLLAQDEAAAQQRLKDEPFNYGFPLRPYQRDAIQAVEAAIGEGRRELLLAMATGTGKTKTCIALIYRLLKARRFRRILFLVDRSALGEQAANAFKDTRMENLQTFASTFGIKELEDAAPDSDTAVHIATVQGMVQRVLHPADDAATPSVDQYDCIVVDECHRGYLLDRELSDTELAFRSHDDYISSYRRVLDYFHAVKVGLTATPALHTTQIFGAPVFTYSYREAVIDGWLVDYEPPIQIRTELSAAGITWAMGEEIKAYHPQRNQIELFKAPDEIKLDVEDFNRKVITEPFNRTVCEYLAGEIDPAGRRKTLVFCANDAHADLVVHLLKQAFAARYGSVEDDAVIKITGAADKPLNLIRRYKNERLPSVAVTVDLLTTGVDVPEICNLVFLRRVGSRILFDQMLGRATRLCPGIDEGGDKEAFRVYDAVRIFEALQAITAMQPVVANPNIAFAQLVREMEQGGAVPGQTSDEIRELAREQFLAKLHRKKRHLGEAGERDFEALAGMPPEAFIRHLRSLTLAEVAQWFTAHPGLGEVLDRTGGARVSRCSSPSMPMH
ncbi:MAG: type I restriction-modification system endonuclease [Rubrivivax sp.]|nr:type I restriction-modification system endonuclease [Rubrivivax sp.]